MIATAGTVAIVAALFCTAGSVTLATHTWIRGAIGTQRAVKWSATGAFVMSTAAFGLLVVALLRDDFSIAYVADNHARATGTVFSIATAWAALEGSILLWTMVLAGFFCVVARQQNRASDDRLEAGAAAVIGLVLIFFLGVLVTVANPFETLSIVPADGPGPNPLLQDNILMAVHPPVLYIGYVGLTVPFAYIMSALVVDDLSSRAIRRAQRWTVIAWTFLTVGIVLGAWWSYAVLGWGGYWAWDPVENASLMPWLAATAYLHSAIVQSRRNALGAWSVALVIASFSLTILGTFLTRSGVIASVHAFSQSEIGPLLLAFFTVILVSSLGVFAWRADRFRSQPRLQSLFSREGAFLVNNLLLAVLTFTVLLGTLFPIVREALTGDQLSVGRPYFDRMAVPLSLLLLSSVAVGPLLRNGQDSLVTLWQRMQAPATVGAGFAALAVVFGQRSPVVLVVLVIGGTVCAGAVNEWLRQRRAGLSFSANPGYWGGQVAHVGFALLAIGVTVSSQGAVRDVIDLNVGETVAVAGYDLTLTDVGRQVEAGHIRDSATISATRSGLRATVIPSIRDYEARGQRIGVPDTWTSIRGEDLYVSINALGRSSANLSVIRYPFVSLIWLGGVVSGLGGVLSIALRRRRSLQAPSVEPDAVLA